MEAEVITAAGQLAEHYTMEYLNMYHGDIVENSKEMIEKYYLDKIATVLNAIENESVKLTWTWKF